MFMVQKLVVREDFTRVMQRDSIFKKAITDGTDNFVSVSAA
jgi:hypothetical protein